MMDRHVLNIFFVARHTDKQADELFPVMKKSLKTIKHNALSHLHFVARKDLREDLASGWLKPSSRF